MAYPIELRAHLVRMRDQGARLEDVADEIMHQTGRVTGGSKLSDQIRRWREDPKVQAALEGSGRN